MRVNRAIVSEYYEINTAINVAKCKICGNLMKSDRTNNLRTHAEKTHKIVFMSAKKKSKPLKKQTEPELVVQKTKQEPIDENLSNSNHSFKAENASQNANSASPASSLEELTNNSISFDETKYEVMPSDALTSVVRFANQLPDATLPTPHDGNSSNIYGMLIEARREMANFAKEAVLPHGTRKTAAQTFFEGLARQTDDARLSPQQFLNLQIAILKAFNKTLFDKN